MKLSVLRQGLDASRAMISLLLLALVGSIGVNLITIVAVFKSINAERTIIVPPTVNKTFWVDDEKVSGEYLEQMAAYTAYLLLNVSPKTAEYQVNQLMKYVSSNSYAELQVATKENIERLRRDNISQIFQALSLQIDEPNMRVAVRGVLSTLINTTKVSEVEKVYSAEFVYRTGRIQLKSFKETSFDNPFKPISSENR